MNNQYHFNIFAKMFNLDPKKLAEVIKQVIPAQIVDEGIEIQLFKKRKTRFFDQNSKGIMKCPYSMRQQIKYYFPFSFDRYICRDGNEYYLTNLGLDLIRGELSFSKTIPEITDTKMFCKCTGLTNTGLNILLTYYDLPYTVKGCGELLTINDLLFYRLQSYREKTASRQYGQKTRTRTIEKPFVQDDLEHSGWIITEPYMTKKGLRVKVELDDLPTPHFLTLSVEELKEKGLLPFLHTGLRIYEKTGSLNIAGYGEVNILRH